MHQKGKYDTLIGLIRPQCLLAASRDCLTSRFLSARPHDGSTVFDMTNREPELIREGLGELELVV